MVRSLLIVDGHSVVADALASLLRQEGWDPVTTLDRATDALAALDRRPPDIVVIGWTLADSDGMDALRRMKARRASLVVVMLGDDDVSQAVTAIRGGASAFVPKSLPAEDLLVALSAVADDGGAWLPSTLLGPVLRGLIEPPTKNKWEQKLALLTAREMEIVELMVGGLDRSEIGRRLGVSLNTVRTHTRNTLAKLDVHSSLEAVSVARRAGIRPSMEQ